MRYREANTVPGKNLLSPRVEGEERRPPLLEGEDREVAGCEVATVRVANTSASSALPQAAQKRLSSGFSRAHAGHLAIHVFG